MAKKKKLKEKYYSGDKNIQRMNIGDVCIEDMKIFGANNNLMRHIPSLNDGMKPGERRILYAMYNLKSTPKKNFIKVARIVGDTVGLFHPHGDSAVSETLVKLAQPWNNIQPLIEGEGNFGSAKGAAPAAARYIEARLSLYAWKCFFEDFNPKYAAMKPTFNYETMEPEYLPSRYPNALINNTFGIGYGVSTGLPTYNLREVLELTVRLMEDREYEDVYLVPDSPTGAFIVDEGQFKNISETGTGKFKMRGQVDIDYETNELIIRSVPLQVKMASKNGGVLDDIINLQEKGKIQGIDRIDDDSNSQNGIKVHIHLKKEIDPITILHTIYTKTQMEKTFPVNFKLIDEYQDYDYSIRKLLLDWIDFRRETKRISYNHKLIAARERQHILETLLHILTGTNGEKTLKAIKRAENSQEIIDFLIKEFKISSLQASNIASMRLSAFSKDAVKKYIKEKDDIDKLVKKYDKVIRSAKKIDSEIKEELLEGIELFGSPRKSEIISIHGEKKIRETDHVVVFTMNGYVKKLPIDTESIGFVEQGDHPIEIIRINNTADLMIFDESGKISKVPVSKLNNSELTSPGDKLSMYATIQGRISAILSRPTPEVIEVLSKKGKLPIYFLMVTKNGMVKKTDAKTYVNIKNELLGMIIKDGDELISVKLMIGDKDILVYTSKGFGVRFPSTEIRETGRMSSGVKAIELSEDEEVIGSDLVNMNDKYLFVITNKGNGKKCTLDAFKTMQRAAKPLRITTLDDNEFVVLIKTVQGEEQYQIYMRNSIETLNVESDVPELSRLAKGKKLIGVRKGDTIIDIKQKRS